MDNENLALDLRHITKRFGKVIANNDVSFDLRHNEILALLGENGSGKTTIMNAVAGIYVPDKGEIFVNGKKVKIKSPSDAFNLNIGVIHQHFKLVDVFTASENIILGTKNNPVTLKELRAKVVNVKRDRLAHLPKGFLGFWVRIWVYISSFFKTIFLPIKLLRLKDDLKLSSNNDLQSIVDKYGFEIELNKKVTHMSVSEKQTVEILKVLYRGAEILILDEPTAVLTPQEIRRLFSILKKMREDGKSIIIITHKLNEVMEISDRVTVLRHGEFVGTVDTDKTSIKQLTELMVGKKVELKIERNPPLENGEKRLSIQHLDIVNRDGAPVLKNINFDCFSGEILGIAGITGSGQRELLEAICGLRKKRIRGGDIFFYDPEDNKEVDLRTLNANQIRELGVRLSFVPEDRLGMGLVANMNLIDNTMLRSYRKGKFGFLDRKAPKKLTEEIIKELDVSTPSPYIEVKKLSGGNVQKMLIGREIASDPKVLMAAYPVRGLDINSSYLVYHLLNEQKEKGAAVIFVGEDLDVLLALSDRIMVIHKGRVAGILDARKTNKDEVGLLMLNGGKE